MLALAVANGLYGNDRAVPLVLDEKFVATGTQAQEAAAWLGDRGVNALLAKAKDHKGGDISVYEDYDGLYGDYLAVACIMREMKTVKQETNTAKLDSFILEAAKSRNVITKALATDCLRLLPKSVGTPDQEGPICTDSCS